jgi:molybdopterin-guanine dinucleotide biosynthesis protein A
MARLLEPLVGRVELVVKGSRSDYGGFPLCVESETLGVYLKRVNQRTGAIWGVAAAMAASSTDWTLVVACDLPFLTEDWLTYLIERAQHSDADMILPAKVLCMVCHRRCAPRLIEEIRRQQPKLGRAMGDLDLEMVAEEEWRPFDTDGRLFFNMNTPEDYAQARGIIGKRAK